MAHVWEVPKILVSDEVLRRKKRSAEDEDEDEEKKKKKKKKDESKKQTILWTFIIQGCLISWLREHSLTL